jgi:uncharacterized membrane protein YdjX (TVP38/TMEM64 family)
MGLSLRTKGKLICLLVLLGGATFFLVWYYDVDLWHPIFKLYKGVLYAVRHGTSQAAINKLKRIISSYGAFAPLAYMLLQVIQVVVAPIPGGAIEALGGALFGIKAGFFYSMVGLFFGSWVAFGLARIFEKVAVEKFVSPGTRKKFDYLIGHEGVVLSFVLFLIPGFPKDALCYILGLTPMHLGIFLAISTIGRIPGTLMACYQGWKVFEHQWATFFILFGVSCLIILVFFIYHDEIHRWIKKRMGVKH